MPRDFTVSSWPHSSGETCYSRFPEVPSETQRGLVTCSRAHSPACYRTDNPLSALPIPPAVPKSQIVPFIGPGPPVPVEQWLQTTATAKCSLQPLLGSSVFVLLTAMPSCARGVCGCVLTLQGQSAVAVTETPWPLKPKIVIVSSFTKKSLQPLGLVKQLLLLYPKAAGD